jgi:hypothetical protein
MTAYLSKEYSDLVGRIKKVQQKKLRLHFLAESMRGITLILTGVFFLAFLEGLFHFSQGTRVIFLSLSIVGTISILAWYIILPFLRLFGLVKTDSIYETSKQVGSFFPSINDRLLDAIEVYEEKERLKEHYSVELIDASFKDLFDATSALDFSKAADTITIRKNSKLFYVALIILLTVSTIIPSTFFGSLHRIVSYSKSFSGVSPVIFLVEPGNVEVVRGAAVSINVKVEGRLIAPASLYLRPKEQRVFETTKMKTTDNFTFTQLINNVVSTTEYYVAMGEESSERYIISVIDRPFIRSLNVTIVPPAYTQLQKKKIDENIGDIHGYAGSTIVFDIVSNKELKKAVIVFSDSNKIDLNTGGLSADGRFTLKKNGSYHISIEDKSGLLNLDPVEYTITTIPDEFPSVEILSPAKNIDITTEKNINLTLRLKDDFGFSKLKLWHRIVQSRYEQPEESFSFFDISIPASGQSQTEFAYLWDLESLHIVPEDIIAYYIEVFDNDNISGPKSGRSMIYTLRLPSLEEVFTDVSKTQDQSLELLQNIAKETEQLKSEMENLQREMKRNPDKTTWQQQKKSEELTKRFDELKKNLEETVKKMDEMVKKMDENRLLSDETMEKYREMQKLLDQLNAPELQNALKKLQESIKRLSSEEMKQAMQKAQLTEEQFKQSLERSIELLKRISIEQKLDEMIKRTEELLQDQSELRKMTEKSDSQKDKEELAKRQDVLKKELDNIEKETKTLREKMEEFSDEMPMEDISTAEEMMQKNQTGKKMQQSTMQMKSGNMQSASQLQQNSENEIKDFKQQLDKTRKSLNDRQMKQIVNEMRRQLENILDLSKKEESLKDASKGIDPNSARFREGEKNQNEVIENLSNVAEALSNVGKKTFAISPDMGKELGEAMRQMGEALQQMEFRNPSGTSQKQTEAMSSLNRAAMMMQNALSSMMQGGKGGMGMAGLMARLQQMAGMQSSINQGTQQAMGMGKGEGEEISSQQAAEYKRLSGQQGAVQKSLEQLAEEAKNSGEYNRLLGDLDRIAQEMREVQNDLAQGKVNPETKQKQERIFSRLLESTKSTRERDFEKRRRADAGTNILRKTPAELNLSIQEGKNRLRDELLKIREGKYTKDYEDLIRKYFEQLEKEEIKR